MCFLCDDDDDGDGDGDGDCDVDDDDDDADDGSHLRDTGSSVVANSGRKRGVFAL